MPALTKKKKPSHRTSTGRRASNTGRAKKDSGSVARFARDNSKALKALGWVFATPAMAAKEASKWMGQKKPRTKDTTVTGTSKGMRGSEKKTTKKSRGRK